METSAQKYLMATACAGLFTFGVMTSFLGATLPELSTRLSFDLARGGTLFSFLYLPQIPMVFLAGPLIDRFGKKPVLVVGFSFCAAALLGMAYAPSYAALAGLLAVLGLGGCSAMSASNTLIPDLYPENPSSALNLGNIFFGLGAIFFPGLVALLTARLGLLPTLWLMTLLVAGVAVVALAQRFPLPPRGAGGFDWQAARRAALDPAVILLAWVLFFYSAVEISTAGWVRTYLEHDFRVSPQGSKTLLTVFWIALMVGRLAASQVVRKVRASRLVLGASVGAVGGLLLLALAPNTAVATAGIVVCGLSYAPVFPTTAGTASTYFSKLFGTVFGFLMTLALLSGVVSPLAIGYVAKHQGLRTGMWLLAVSGALLFVTQFLFVRYERRRFLMAATPTKKCPRCGLINPAIGQRCDCGYDFETGKVERAIQPSAREARIRKPILIIPLVILYLLEGILIIFTLVLRGGQGLFPASLLAGGSFILAWGTSKMKRWAWFANLGYCALSIIGWFIGSFSTPLLFLFLLVAVYMLLPEVRRTFGVGKG